ncbi:hypothetical protein BDB01DRAFT_807017 [Pilobolus umbonatus]|nr:hypothetical protein BDB01DRAFT_807017 [Pilobolus umbonatus]
MDSNSMMNTPPSARWIQDEDDSDNDQIGLVPHNRGYKLKKWGTSESQFGGNKLRAPKSLAEEAEFMKGGKKRTVIKRKRKGIEDVSDEEEDPYTLINIEDILSPIEVPTDIVRRPALRRIIRSTQIDTLAKTSMEFIEGEKNFNKILCRLSTILHHDDPRYLDLSFDRTVEQRKRYKEDKEAANAAAATLSNSSVVDPLEPAQLEANIDSPSTKEEEIDVEAREIVKRVKELLLENINYSNEYMSRLQGARNKLCKASMQKETLWKELKANAKEEDRRNKSYSNNSSRDYL